MSANWKAGDRAVCIEPFIGEDVFNGIKYFGSLPSVGTVYLVADVEIYRGETFLFIVGLHPRFNWIAKKFRKLVPACDRVQIEAEAIA